MDSCSNFGQHATRPGMQAIIPQLHLQISIELVRATEGGAERRVRPGDRGAAAGGHGRDRDVQPPLRRHLVLHAGAACPLCRLADGLNKWRSERKVCMRVVCSRPYARQSPSNSNPSCSAVVVSGPSCVTIIGWVGSTRDPARRPGTCGLRITARRAACAVRRDRRHRQGAGHRVAPRRHHLRTAALGTAATAANHNPQPSGHMLRQVASQLYSGMQLHTCHMAIGAARPSVRSESVNVLLDSLAAMAIETISTFRDADQKVVGA